jgi:hypothetical protein
MFVRILENAVWYTYQQTPFWTVFLARKDKP